jgi:hypothetical protein
MDTEILQGELQLLVGQLLGAAAELVATETLDQQAQPVIFGVQLVLPLEQGQQHLLQQRWVVRQGVGIDLHAAMMNKAAAPGPEPIPAKCDLIRPVRDAAAVPVPATRSRQAAPPVAPPRAGSAPSCWPSATRTGRAQAALSEGTIQLHCATTA